jgi:hypothetical protein
MLGARLPLTIVLLALTTAPAAVAVEHGPRPLLEGLSFPTNMAFLHDGTLLFTEKETGSVRVVTPEGLLVDRPFITLPVIDDLERGLLGIAVHPDFAREPWVYLYRSDPSDGLNRLVRWRLAGPGNASEVARFLSGVTDVALGPRGLVYVATADAISTIDPATVPGSAGPADDGATSLAGDDDRDVQGWVAVIAAVVLASALIARIVAGRRARPPH